MPSKPLQPRPSPLKGDRFKLNAPKAGKDKGSASKDKEARDNGSADKDNAFEDSVAKASAKAKGNVNAPKGSGRAGNAAAQHGPIGPPGAGRRLIAR